jgi:HD-like signal output (HDOD) protein
MLLSDDTGARKVAKFLSVDASLVAQILKVVNSPYFSIPKEIKDVHIAVAYLGLNEIYRIATTLSVVNNLRGRDKEAFSEIWFHSVLTAMTARHLAKKFEPKININELWAATILHDIGKFVYLKFFPEHYKALQKYKIDMGCLFSEAEIHFAFPTSSYLGTLLCDRWRLPKIVKKVCETHTLTDLINKKEQIVEDPFIRMVTIANLITILITEKLNDELKNKITNEIIMDLKMKLTEFPILAADILVLKEDAEKIKLI